jgi:hypothetical protein
MTEISANVDQPLAGGGRQLIHRIRFLAGMSVAAAIFWYFGRWAARPVDPEGPITLLLVDQGVVGMAELLGLAVIASGLAVAICGGGSAERGPLAIAIGLATLGLSGSQLDQLLLYRVTSLRPGQTAADIFPTWGLIAETWLWLALIAVGFVVGRWVDSWFGQSADPGFAAPTDFRHALGVIILAAIVAWCTVAYTLGGESNPLLKGQIYFSIALAFVVGSLVAHWFFQRTSSVWMLVAVAVVATAAYAIASPNTEELTAAMQSGGYITLRPVCRPLPIEFAAMGAVGAFIEQDAMAFFRAMFGVGADADIRDSSSPQSAS